MTVEQLGVDIAIAMNSAPVVQGTRALKDFNQEVAKANTQNLSNNIFGDLNSKRKDISIAGAQIAARLKEEQLAIKKVAQSLKDAKKEATKFKMEYLGIMFGGMAIMRSSQRVLKSLFDNYKNLTKGATDPLNQSMTRLNANFKFMQFAIMDAAGPLIISFADGLASLSHTIAKMDPVILKAVFGAIVGFFVLGAALFVGGQGVLFLSSLKTAAINLGLLKVAATDAAPKITAAAGALGALVKVGAVLSTITFAVDLVRLFTLEGKDNPSVIGLLLTGATAGAFLGAWIGGPIGALIGSGLGVAAASIAIILDANFETDKSKGTFTDKLSSALSAADGVSLVKWPIVFFEALQGKVLIDTQTGLTFDADTREILNRGFAEGLTIDMFKGTNVKDQMAPTIDSLMSASILSHTTAEDISKLGIAISTNLTPAFNGKAGLNVPLTEAVGLTATMNTNISTQNQYLKDILPQMVADTDERTINASAIQSQADANFRLAESIIEIAEAKARARSLAAASSGV